MCVASELSSEIAEAILVRNIGGGNAGRLLEVVVALHMALRQLSREERSRRRSKTLLKIPPPQGRGATHGLHCPRRFAARPPCLRPVRCCLAHETV